MVKAQVISLKIYSTPLGERVYVVFQATDERTLAIGLPADRRILDSLQVGKTIALKQRSSGRLYWTPPLQSPVARSNSRSAAASTLVMNQQPSLENKFP